MPPRPRRHIHYFITIFTVVRSLEISPRFHRAAHLIAAFCVISSHSVLWIQTNQSPILCHPDCIRKICKWQNTHSPPLLPVQRQRILAHSLNTVIWFSLHIIYIFVVGLWRSENIDIVSGSTCGKNGKIKIDVLCAMSHELTLAHLAAAARLFIILSLLLLRWIIIWFTRTSTAVLSGCMAAIFVAANARRSQSHHKTLRLIMRNDELSLCLLMDNR